MLKNERLFEPVSFVMAIAIGVPDVCVVEPAKTVRHVRDYDILKHLCSEAATLFHLQGRESPAARLGVGESWHLPSKRDQRGTC